MFGEVGFMTPQYDMSSRLFIELENLAHSYSERLTISVEGGTKKISIGPYSYDFSYSTSLSEAIVHALTSLTRKLADYKKQ